MNFALLFLPFTVILLGCTFEEILFISDTTYNYSVDVSVIDGEGTVSIACHPSKVDDCTDPYYNGTIELNRRRT